MFLQQLDVVDIPFQTQVQQSIIYLCNLHYVKDAIFEFHNYLAIFFGLLLGQNALFSLFMWILYGILNGACNRSNEKRPAFSLLHENFRLCSAGVHSIEGDEG